jgi:hypothetical protein
MLCKEIGLNILKERIIGFAQFIKSLLSEK